MEQLLTSVSNRLARHDLPATYMVDHRGKDGVAEQGRLNLQLLLQDPHFVIVTINDTGTHKDFQVYGGSPAARIQDVLVWLIAHYPSRDIVAHSTVA